jgi:release factor glutamine methyltransferase
VLNEKLLIVKLVPIYRNEKIVNIFIFADMQQAIKYIQSALLPIYSDSEITELTYQLLGAVTACTRTDIILNKNTKISDNQRAQLETFVKQLEVHTPIQYVLGTTEFYGLIFEVNASVLIPRPETEELVDWIKQEVPAKNNLSLLDIGTGSGCIAIALKKIYTDSCITAFDVSEQALETATRNAGNNHVDVLFSKKDILLPGDITGKWDVIVSNPPYIPQNECNKMDNNVLDFEPHTALFVPDENPLLFYKAIADFAHNNLTENGWLFFEIHRDFGNQVMELLDKKGFNDIQLRKDMAGNNRMICCRKYN